MHTKKKLPLVFWEIGITILVVLFVTIYIAISLSRGSKTPANETAPQQGAATASAETRPSLPLPESNPYKKTDFTYEGDYLTCTAGQSMLGVDVSYWQGIIDWQQVRQAGVEFTILRLGWRGSEQGILAEDDYVYTNYTGAKDAGLLVGGYFFSQAITPEEAIEEARYVLDIIDGWEVDMPIVFDWEYIDQTARTADVDIDTLIACSKAFCQTITDAGYEAMIYFNLDRVRDLYYLQELSDYGFWLAMYDRPMEFAYKVDMWQYTCTGTVPGIDTEVDLNLYFKYE